MADHSGGEDDERMEEEQRPGVRPGQRPEPESRAERQDGEELLLVASLKPESVRKTQDYALKQNITTLHNRVNELGVAEPVIQQQGLDRVVVQLPGVQDTAKAKDIIGRTATLEIRLVNETPEGKAAERGAGRVLSSAIYARWSR